jgi:hypothetical protein
MHGFVKRRGEYIDLHNDLGKEEGLANYLRRQQRLQATVIRQAFHFPAKRSFNHPILTLRISSSQRKIGISLWI